MPIARNPAEHNHNWIPREAETEFNNLLKDGKAYVLPLVGVGGAGKTSLLRRFFNYCERYEVPAVYIDLPRLTVSSAVDMWLRLETVHTKAFDEQRKKLNTSYETLTAMLQTYGDNASSAADLLQKSMGKDEHYGLAVGALRDAGKLLYEFWQRKENQQHQNLLKKPEEALLAALASDFTKHGVILIDTLEQASKQNLQTRLTFCEDGGLETPVAENPHALSLLDYCAGMAHFLFDKPVVMVMAGRPPAIRELGALPVEYFAPTVVVPAFTPAEIRTYLEKSLPRHIASPQDSDISKLQQLTLGNPFLLERVVRLLADWQPLWEWQAQQWQPLLNSFQHDERHGLLLYVTQRLLTHVLPDDRAFWRLALPRQFIHRDMAELLFPKAEFGEQSGLQRLKTYEEKGTVYREQDPDRYFLHDETRAAFSAWARRENVWLDKAACETHAQLANWIQENQNWKLLEKQFLAWHKAGRKGSVPPEFGNSLLLEGAYHYLMADDEFDQRYQGYNRHRFWEVLSTSISLSNAEKMQVGASLPNLSLFQIQEFTTVFEDEISEFGKLFTPKAQRWMEEQSKSGKLPPDWAANVEFFQAAFKRFPTESEFISLFCNLVSHDEQEQVYSRAIDIDPTNARNLGNFAVFVKNVRKDYDRAESLYAQSLAADPEYAHGLGNFAVFMENVRKDYDRAELLYEQSLAADPTNARNLGWFALFMETIRKDYDRAELLYEQSIAADPEYAHGLGIFAYFMHYTRKDYDRAETLYQQAIDADPNHACNLSNFAVFMENVRKDYDRAELLYEQAIAADPTNARNLGNFADFVEKIRKDYDRAELLYEQLLAADPTNARNLGWFAYFMHYTRKDYDRAELLYEQLLAADPTNARNLGNFALFMETIRKDYDRAEKLYAQSLAADPTNARNLGWFAYFMHYTRKDYDRAELLYEQLLAADPTNARNLGNFALFMETIRKDYDRAEKLYAQSLAADPEYAYGLGNFADFVEKVRKDYDRAELLYEQSLAADPTNARNLGNLAVFMENVRKDYERAEVLYEQSLVADPNHANNLGNFAYFMHYTRKDYDRAELLYEQSLAVDPNHANNLGNFAVFMENVRKDYDRAEVLYAQAVAADPTDAHNLGNFAYFMHYTRKDYDRAELLYEQSIEVDPKNARNLGNFAYFMHYIRKDYDRAELLYEQSIEVDPTNARNLGRFAIFLHLYRKNYPQAKQLYHRVLAIEPNETNNMGNLAQLYLLEGDKTQAKALIDQAFALNPEAVALKLELWFYRFAHFPEDYPQAVTEIMTLLETGERDEGWDFSGNIAQAEKDGHPKVALLQALADVITGKAELDSLDNIA